jgi:hypothetical protein
VFAPSDHDLLIVAGDAPLPLPPQARVFEQPGLAKELYTVHVLGAGDLDARYLGSRATLEPLFASYGMPANSDYAPVLDLNAARHRFMEKSAAGIVALLNAEVPILELLEPTRSRRAVNPLFAGAYSFERVENTRLAWYARNFLMNRQIPPPEGIGTQLQKDLELLKLRLFECREPRELDVWLHSAVRVARAINPYLAADDAAPVWGQVMVGPCFAALRGFQRRWVELFRAVAVRDSAVMAQIGAELLASQSDAGGEAREYLLMAAMSGLIATGARDRAAELWRVHSAKLPRAAAMPAFRLLRCHAETRGAAACAEALRPYAER